jgi:hypothetical protein
MHVYYQSNNNYFILSWNLLRFSREYPNTFRSLRVFIVTLTAEKKEGWRSFDVRSTVLYVNNYTRSSD